MLSLNASGAGCPLIDAHSLIFSSDYCEELFLSMGEERSCGDRTQVRVAPSCSVRFQGHNKADIYQTSCQNYFTT